MLIRKGDVSPKDNKQYKYESPYLKNVNSNANINKVPQNIVPSKVNAPIGNNNLNIRPISSNNNQKPIIAGNNIVSSIKKVPAGMPEPKKVGGQIKIAENLIKGGNYNYNYNKNAQPSAIARPPSGQRPDSGKAAGNVGGRYVIKK